MVPPCNPNFKPWYKTTTWEDWMQLSQFPEKVTIHKELNSSVSQCSVGASICDIALRCIALYYCLITTLVRECQCSLYLSHCIALLYCPICDENIRGVSAVSICDSWQEKHARGGSATWEPTKVQSYCQFHHHQHHCNFASLSSIIHNNCEYCYNCEYCISANSNPTPTPIQRNWFWSFNPGNFYGVIIIDLWWSFDHACSTIDDDDAI